MVIPIKVMICVRKKQYYLKKKCLHHLSLYFLQFIKKNGNTHVLELEGQGLIFTK